MLTELCVDRSYHEGEWLFCVEIPDVSTSLSALLHWEACQSSMHYLLCAKLLKNHKKLSLPSQKMVNMIFPTNGWILNFFLTGELICFHSMLCLLDCSLKWSMFPYKTHHLSVYSVISALYTFKVKSPCDVGQLSWNGFMGSSCTCFVVLSFWLIMLWTVPTLTCNSSAVICQSVFLDEGIYASCKCLC